MARGVKVTIEQLKERLNKCLPYNDYLIDTYIDMKSKMTFICPIHGNYEQSPNLKLTQNQGCPKCGIINTKNKRIRNDIEIKKILDNCTPFYEYNIYEYKNTWSKMTFICPIHGAFKQSFLNRSLNKKCLKCSRIEQPIKKRLNNKKIIFEKLHKSNPILDTYIDMKSKMTFICPIHGNYEQSPNLKLTQNQGCPKCSFGKTENIISDIFENKFIQRDRNIIKPKEIDFLNNDYKFGIEYNGIMYHSYGNHKNERFNNYGILNKNKHLDKLLNMEEKGFQLFYIKDIDWNNPIKNKIWISIINNKLNISKKIFARKLKIIDLSKNKKIVKDFFINNHLQGHVGYKYAYGLIDENSIIYNIMTFGKSRYNKNIEYELLRYCNLINYTVIGGASKLLKYFEKIHKPKNIISYANRDWSQGNLYKQLGFKFIKDSPPNYFYIDPKGNILNRLSTQKHKLKKLLPNYNNNQTEIENMINNNYRIYYDTGNLVFLKEF
jgi:hypothetical protein